MRTSNFALRLQPSLYEGARLLAEREGVAMNQLINVAVAQMLAADSTFSYIEARARRANAEEALAILNKAGRGNPPMPGDELPEGWESMDKLESAPVKAPKARGSTRNKSPK